jgi:predicted dehydrogenase
MIRIGIVGAENSHSWHVARVCNVTKDVPARVTAIWGETRKFAEKAAAEGQIPLIVKDWRELLEQVDGVMIDHRHPAGHAEVATWFVERGIPCFVDKPFTWKLAEGKKLCALARKKKVPLVSFSLLMLQKSFADFRKAMSALGTIGEFVSIGPADIRSKYGGVYFYGIHQVVVMVDLFGTEIERVRLTRHGRDGIGVVEYKNGPLVTMQFVNSGNHTFHWTAIGEKQVLPWTYQTDPVPFVAGARTFVDMIRTRKEPYSHQQLLAPIAVLEAMQRSLKLGKAVRPSKVS